MDRAQKAKDNFLKGYNCAQAVALAFSDLTPLDEKTTARAASAFGGGMGRLREVCGAVSGAFMAAALVEGYDDPKNNVGKTELYRKIQELAARFKEENGSIVCRELLSGVKGAEAIAQNSGISIKIGAANGTNATGNGKIGEDNGKVGQANGKVEANGKVGEANPKRSEEAIIRQTAASCGEGSIKGADLVEICGEPEKRTPQYYKKRPCAELVYNSARILENHFKSEGIISD
jgi:C_GCAxxG_C_C family probable redox protein